MRRRECMGSLLMGILVILFLGSFSGSIIGGAFSLGNSQKDVSNSYYSTMYSSGMADTKTDTNIRGQEKDITVVILTSTLSMSLIILLGFGISVYKINQILKYEPMELLSRQKE
jgi:hypothetical protein